jgi:integrase
MAELLLQNLPAGADVIADKGYDADWIRDLIEDQGCTSHIPPKSNRYDGITYSKRKYRKRNLIERCFNNPTRQMWCDCYNSVTLKRSFRRLVEDYYGSAVYTTMEESSRRVRKQILDKLCDSVWKNTKMTIGQLPYKQLKRRHVREMRDLGAADAPEAANSRLKAIRQVLSLAVADDEIEHSPADDVPYIPSKGGGHHTWTVEEIRQYEMRHPIGTMARLTLALLLFTGQRRSDVIRLGEHMVHIKDGRRFIKFTQFKGRNKAQPIELDLPILPELDAVIAATPRIKPKKGKPVSLTYIQTEFGLAFSGPGFGNKMRDWCNQAGLPHCSAHGVRKAGATIAAENGATTHDLMGIFGWKTLKEAARHTEKVRKHPLAAKNMYRVVPEQTEVKCVPLSEGLTRPVRKRAKKI